MPLPWVRLDTSMPDHPKIIALCSRGNTGMAAAFLWVCSLAYAGKHGTDGLITRAVLPRINGKAALAVLLVEYRLWETHPDGWRIHDYEEYQMLLVTEVSMRQIASIGGAAAAARMTPEQRSDRARKAAAARWNGHGPPPTQDAYR